MVCQETHRHHILVDYNHKEVIQELIIFGIMTTTVRSACQIKLPNLALTTKRTETNIKRLKIYLSNETKDRSNIK